MGGCRCSYKNCKNTTKTTDNIHFFHYPVKHKERCIKWIENARKPKFYELEEDQLRNKVICEVHFEDRWFPNSQKKRLLQGAVPTLDIGCEDEIPQSDTPLYLPHQLNDVQVLPANEDGTIFVLDTDNMFSRSQKIESYVYQNGVLVRSNPNQNTVRQVLNRTLPNKTVLNTKPSTSHSKNVYYNANEMDLEPAYNTQGGEEREYKEVIVKKEIPDHHANANNIQEKNPTLDYASYNAPNQPYESSSSNKLSERRPNLSRQLPIKNVGLKSGIEKTVSRNYLRKIKQHSREIATIKRMLKQKTIVENKPDTKTILTFLEEQLPPSLFTIISLILGSKNELTDDDIEFFTTVHRTSPEVYQLLSEKYKWNLPSVDIVESPGE